MVEIQLQSCERVCCTDDKGANDIRAEAESAKGQERGGHSGLTKAQFWFYHGFKEVVATQNDPEDRDKTTTVAWDRAK